MTISMKHLHKCNISLEDFNTTENTHLYLATSLLLVIHNCNTSKKTIH